MQSVQGAEIWGVLLALQSGISTHVWGGYLNVVNHVGRINAGGRSGQPFPLVNDGGLILLVRRLVQWRGLGSTQVTKVKGHADEGMVALGRVREVDRIGNNEADAAADMSRRRVHCSITDARWLLHCACARRCPIVQKLHHFFIATARTVVNSDDLGGTSLHPVVWSNAANPKSGRVDRAVRDFGLVRGQQFETSLRGDTILVSFHNVIVHVGFLGDRLCARQ